MVTRRRVAWAAVVVVASVVGGGWLGHRSLVARVHTELAARQITAARVTLGLGAVRLDDVVAGPARADHVDVDVLALLAGRVEATVTGVALALDGDRGDRRDGDAGASGGARPLAVTLVDATFTARGLEARGVGGQIARDAAGRWEVALSGALPGLGDGGADAPFTLTAARAGEDRLDVSVAALDLGRLGAVLGKRLPPGLGRAWVEIVDDHAVLGFDGIVTAPFPGGDVTAPTRVTLTGAPVSLTTGSGPVVVDVVWSGIPARALGDVAALSALAGADPGAPVGPPSGAPRPDAWVVVLDAVPVADLLATPPLADLDPRIAAAKVSGRISVVASVAWTGAAWELDPLVSVDDLVVTGVANTAAWRWGPFVHAIRAVDGSWGQRTTGEGTPGWAPRATVPEALVLAVLAAEDAWFYHHEGFTISAQRAAWREHAIPGGLRRGGSTLTQQLAKNLVSGREHAMKRKLVELLAASQMEHELGKKRILELYLNIVELGPGIYGVKEGARAWFDKPVSALTPGESLWLVMCLPSPRRMWRDAPPGDSLGPWGPRFEELRGKLGQLGIDPATVTRPRLPTR